MDGWNSDWGMKGSRGKVSLAVCLVAAAVSAPQALAGHIRLVSTGSAEHVGVGTSDYADITADGRYVVFDTEDTGHTGL